MAKSEHETPRAKNGVTCTAAKCHRVSW